jgi:hypothetical protein
VVYAYQLRFGVLLGISVVDLYFPYIYFSGQFKKGFAGWARAILISTINFPLFHFLFRNSSVGLNYNSGLTFSKKLCKNYSGLPLVILVCSMNLRSRIKRVCLGQNNKSWAKGVTLRYNS